MKLYHYTNSYTSVLSIMQTRKWVSKENPKYVYFTDTLGGCAEDYGQYAVSIDVDERYTALDDEFPDGEQHFRVLSRHLNAYARNYGVIFPQLDRESSDLMLFHCSDVPITEIAATFSGESGGDFGSTLFFAKRPYSPFGMCKYAYKLRCLAEWMVDPQHLQITATDENETIAKVRETCVVSIDREHARKLLKSSYAAFDLMCASYSLEESELHPYFSEDISFDLIVSDGLHSFAWWLQGKQSRIGKRMGYLGVSSVDEQGPVWMADMLGKEYLLGDYFETPSSVSHRERNPEYIKFVSDMPTHIPKRDIENPRSSRRGVTHQELLDMVTLDASSIDLRGKYVENRILIGYDSTDVEGLTLYKCYPKVKGAVNVDSKVSPSDVSIDKDQLFNVDFQYADLEGATLRKFSFIDSTNFGGADFSRADMQGSRLIRAVLSNTYFEYANLQNCDFSGSEGSASFKGADLSFSVLSNSRLWGMNFRDANLFNVDVNFSRINNANFIGANLEGCNINLAIIEYAIFSAQDKEYVTELFDWRPLPKNTIFLGEGADISRTTLTFYDLTHLNLRGTSWVDTQVLMCNLSHSNLSNSNLRGCRFKGDDEEHDEFGRPEEGAKILLKHINFSECDLRKTRFRNADLSNADFRSSKLDGCSFVDSTIDYANFSGCELLRMEPPYNSTLVGASFENADVRLQIFFMADLTDANFKGANLEGAYFIHCTLNNTDFRGANLSRVTYDFEDMFENATLSDAQLASMTFDPDMDPWVAGEERESMLHKL